MNLTSVYLSVHHVLPIMGKQGPDVIVSNASAAGIAYLGKPQVAYSTAKAALLPFTRVTAVIYAPKNVRLNCVVPGMIFTPMIENPVKSEKAEDREVYRKITQHNVSIRRVRQHSRADHSVQPSE